MHMYPIEDRWLIHDAVDRDTIAEGTWFIRVKGAYVSVVGRKKNSRKLTTLGRVLMDVAATEPRQVDHKNRDPLDFRRDNLRLATPSQQGANKLSINATSGYKGVRWRKEKRRWQARMAVDGKQVYSSMHTEVEAAARAYDAAVTAQYGDYALTNKQLGLLD